MFFKKRKKKRLEVERIQQENINIMTEGISENDLSDKKKVQDYILNCCGQIVEARKELEEEQSEYRIVTDYLNDIQLLEELPKEEMKEIRSAAENVQNLSRQRVEYQNSEKKISDVQFVQMQREEDSIPAAIKRLKENEDYQNKVKRDMNYLEGEKTEWHYNKFDLLRQQKILKAFSFVLPGLLIMSVAILFVLQTGFHFDVTYVWMAVIFAAAVGGFGIYLKMSYNQTEIRRSEVNMNHAIVLLNKLKFRYVNVTNAVEYVREKYHVKNAYEFNYLWEQYLNEVKEREKFRQANEDLEYFNEKLIRLLNRYRLYDAEVWVNQSSALLDKKEMVEVKHNLIVRRQKLRSRIEYNAQNIRDRRKEINGILKREKIDTPQIREIIDSIDRLNME